jgi:hypothetical protein
MRRDAKQEQVYRLDDRRRGGAVRRSMDIPAFIITCVVARLTFFLNPVVEERRQILVRDCQRRFEYVPAQDMMAVGSRQDRLEESARKENCLERNVFQQEIWWTAEGQRLTPGALGEEVEEWWRRLKEAGCGMLRLVSLWLCTGLSPVYDTVLSSSDLPTVSTNMLNNSSYKYTSRTN